MIHKSFLKKKSMEKQKHNEEIYYNKRVQLTTVQIIVP